MKPELAKHHYAACEPIHGWFSFEAAMLFAWIDEIQAEQGIAGDLFEIGVHHGKSSVFMGAMAHQHNQQLSVCDIFASQGGNVSGSGKGDRDIFERNMSQLVEAGLRLTVHEKLSGGLTADAVGSGHRVFHVDGGHNADEALADLELALSCIVENGVIVLDDPFRQEWPGVTEATVRFLDRHPELQACVVGFNKLLLARQECADLYRDRLTEDDRRLAYGLGYPWHVKDLPFVGKPLTIYFKPSSVKESRRSLLKKLLKGA